MEHSRSHLGSQIKPWEIQENRNCSKYLFQPQRYETRYQLQEKICKNTNTWRLNNTLVHNQEITEEIKEEIKKYLETNDNEKRRSKTYGMQQKQF